MTRLAKTVILVSISFTAAAIAGVIMLNDGERLNEAAKLRTEEQIGDFARRNGVRVLLIRQHMVDTYIVRIRFPVLSFITREFRWGDEVRGGFQSKVTIFDER